MNEDGIYDVCDVFGLRSGSPHGGRMGLNVSISCPLAVVNHGDPDDWNTSCSVSVRDDEPSLAKCFSFNCNYKGSFYRMLAEGAKARGNPPVLLELLEQIAPTEKFTFESSLARSKKRYEKEVDAWSKPRIADHSRDLMAEGRFERYANSIPHYALTRGLTKETCKAWGLGNDKERKCLVFPVRRHDGKLVGMTGRYVHYPDSPTKYHNYAGLNKSRYLFGEHMLKPKAEIIICEGQVDAILTWQHLAMPTLAVLGEGFSRDHARTIQAFEPPCVYLFMDNDAAGRMAAEKVEFQLHGRVPVKIMLPPTGMDPGELSQTQAQQAFEAAAPVMGKIRWEEITTD